MDLKGIKNVCRHYNMDGLIDLKNFFTEMVDLNKNNYYYKNRWQKELDFVNLCIKYKKLIKED